MKTNKYYQYLFVFTFIAVLFTSCTKDDNERIEPEVTVNNYENGFFLIHEGWFGHGTGSLSFYNFETNKITDSVFQKENPDKGFEPSNSTLQYGTVFNGNLFLVSKVGGPVVVANAKTLKEVGRIPAQKGNDWRAFTGLDKNTGLLSSKDGIYIVNLNTMSANTKLVGINGQAGDMLKTDKYLFAQSQREDAIIYNLEDFSIKEKIKNVSLGFVQTPNKKVWYTSGKKLISINQENLQADTIELSFNTNHTFFAWYSSPMVASSKDDAVYIMANQSFGGGKAIYQYIDGDLSSLEKPFITTPINQSFYKNNLGYDKKHDEIITSTVQDGFGDNYTKNNLYFHNAQNGDLRKMIPFNKIKDSAGNDVSYFFTAMPVFH